MQKMNTKNPKSTKRILEKALSLILLVTMLVQICATPCFALLENFPFFSGSSGKNNGISSGIGKFDSDAIISQLKKDFLKSINQDLISKIEDYELRGEVDVILSFSDESLVASYTSSAASAKMTFGEYRATSAAAQIENRLKANQSKILAALEEAGLISAVKYNYLNILDGAFVKTTYENIAAICDFGGVERIMISNTYEALEAVENPVDVYETGIFNSSDITYTGKRTIIAVLDTGCDYSHSAFTTYQIQDPRYNRDDIAALLESTFAYQLSEGDLEAREVYYGNITKDKIAFGYDYADSDPDIMPFSESHGTHVAGVIGGKDDVITGVAIDTQFAIMKVFSDYQQGARDGDILAALEDSVILGVDAINMSLGTSCGFTREEDDEYRNEIYNRIEEAGISLIVAASNDYSSGYGSDEGNTNKTSNPDSATVGAPSTFDAALSVASINGNKDKYMVANGNLEVFFFESVNQSVKKYDFFKMLGVTKDNPRVEYEYVTIPGLGYAINYSGLDVEGKIALVRRGDISFEEKIQYAQEAGAAGVIIYNNVFGDITMTVGNQLKIPAVSIGRDQGEAMASRPSGTIVFDYNNLAGPFMSDFSSWGPTPDLKLKPEITAHGGNILSAIIGGEYEEYSGTSMAAPNMAGIVILIRQYVNELNEKNNLGLTIAEKRDLVNQLCMSTATIALDSHGNPYSPRKQGAGIADIAKATTTPAYLYVDGIGKTKLELYDDPTRSGVYTMSINLKNLSTKTVSYRLGNITMTESVSTSDPEYVAEIAYLLSNSSAYEVSGATFQNGIISVGAGATATVKVTVTLSASDKAYLNSNFKNGMYVEGFLTFSSTDENGIDLNAPFLAFYGDWGEAPIFDLDYYEVETEAHNNAIDDDDKIKADYYATTPTGTYYYDYVLPLGSYVYKIDETKYNPIPATAERAAVSYYMDAISGVYGVFTGLLRGAKEMSISVVDTSTGKVVWEEVQTNCAKAHYNGGPYAYIAHMDIPMYNQNTYEVFGSNNTRFEVTMTAKLDWDGENRNSRDTYTFSFYVDYEAPSIVDATFRTEYDKSRKENRYYVDLMVYDNHYAMSVRPIIVYDFEENGEMKKNYSSLTEYPIPVYQENRGETTKVTVEITDYIELIANSDSPEGLTFYIDDYAMNGGICYVPFPETESDDLEFLVAGLDSPVLNLDIHQTLDLADYLVHKDSTTPVNKDYLKMLTWTSSDESVIAINGGKIEALKAGSAVISVTGDTWVTTTGTDRYGRPITVPISKSIVINVSETEINNPNSSALVDLKDFKFVSYNTIFAFNSDIDLSDISVTGSINYFDGSPQISFYPSEQIKLQYAMEPWNIAEDRYTLKWSSSNPRVATVDENGLVTAVAEGSARITLQLIDKDGKASLLAARCAITVKSEFIIENRVLVAYKGNGGEVVIPEDKGIMTIGSFAFCHFNLNNSLEVEKDENGYYDIDLKKEPLGNNTVTSVVVPKGVETIEKYAFYNCKLLNSVQLPDSCKTIGDYAFANCDVLEDVNLDHVKVICNYAFNNCESLTCVNLGGINLSGVYAIGDYAFSGARFDSVTLTKLSRVGVGAFANCPKLETVELGKKTRISESMFENTAIKEIVIYSDTISDYAFADCKSLVSVDIRNDITYLGESAFMNCKNLESVAFGGACEQIATFAFYGCTSLEEFCLPNCSVKIGDGVFASSALSKLVFAKNSFIAENGVSVFEKIRSLTVDVSASDFYKVEGNIVYSKDGSRLVLLLPGYTASSFEVPAGVREICDGAFSSNNYITQITFAAGSLLEHVGIGAFGNCTALKSVALPEREITVGASAFMGTKALKTINLDGVKTLGDYAFESSAITSVTLRQDNVKIGIGAFYGASALKSATIGKGAVIGEYAFCESGIESVTFLGGDVSVTFLGGDVTVLEGAFCDCTRLKTFDFTKLVGKLGDYAFYGCTSLTAVDAPYVTEIGVACFADCYSLESFSAENLEIIGDYAFAAYSEQSQQGANFKTITTPKLQKIGEYAFYGCPSLRSIDLSGVTEIKDGAFAFCTALRTVTLTESLTELPDFVFYGCTYLSTIDLSNLVRIGVCAFYNARLPETLQLTKAEYVGEQAFMQESKSSNLVTVIAPKLTEIGEQAFCNNVRLANVSAPVLESIGAGAFAFTGITEFEVFESLRYIGPAVFEGCESLVAFFITVDGEKLYDKACETVMIKEGVLYTVADKGYILSVYPMAKTDKVFEVAEGTVKIEYSAACDNKSLERVVLPESLRFIGNYAFYGCTNLDTIVFKSYYAPVLEGSINEAVEITPDNVSDFPGFDKLYKYDYYYKFEGTVLYTYYYHQFVDIISSQNANALTYVIPKNSKGYDSKLYAAYFTLSETEDAGVVTGPYAWAFIDAANNLPNNRDVDRFDEALINAAINAYNALIGKAEEKAFVADSYFEKFAKARSQYNVSVVDNKIAHLFDMDNSKYSYELVKEARGLYLALTDAERERLADGARLESKIAELALAMGVELDFTKTYEEHFPKQDLPSDDGADQTTEKSDKWIVIVIVAAIVVLAACGAGVLVVANRKKKSALAEVSETDEEAANYDENTNVDGVQSEVETSDEGVIDTDKKED